MKKYIVLLMMLSIFLIINAQNYSSVKIYLLDRDGGLKFQNPDNPELFVGYEYNIVKAFEDIGFSVELRNLEVNELFPANITDYAAVFVTSGHRSSIDEILTADEIKILSEYLSTGGCLYLEGNNIIQYLSNVDSLFLQTYFNVKMIDPNDDLFAGYDTIITDTSFSFFRPYKIVYPDSTEPDFGIDVYGPADVTDTFFHSIMVYDSRKSKLYTTTASAYSTPLPKAGPVWRSYISTIDMGAYASPYIKREYQIADSTANQLIRASYLRDILRLFGIGKTLVINHSDDETYDGIMKSLSNHSIAYDYVIVKAGNDGPFYDSLSKYQNVIWYTGVVLADSVRRLNLTANDITNLSIYMDFGGNLLLTGENIAEEIGNPDQGIEASFLTYYFGLDYIGPSITDIDHVVEKTSIYYPHIDLFSTLAAKSPDMLLVDSTANGLPAFYFRSTIKAPISSGIIKNGSSFRSAYFSFPLEYVSDFNALDILLTTTLVEQFGVDTTFSPLSFTGLHSVNISHYIENDNIVFNVHISNTCGLNSLILKRDNTVIDKANINLNENTYTLSGKNKGGNYKIIMNGEEIYSLKLKPRYDDTVNITIQNGSLFIESAYDIKNIEIYDITGTKNMEFNGIGNSLIYNEFNNLSNGVYFIKVITNNKEFIKKLIKY